MTKSRDTADRVNDIVVDGSGNVGIGTSSPTLTDFSSTATGVHIKGSSQYGTLKLESNDNKITWLATGTNATYFYVKDANPLAFGTNNTERMRIDSDGHAIIPNGVTLGTATGVYNAANTLDDYEEGTWTVTFYDASSGGNASPTTGTGKYTKIGNQVSICLNASINNIDTTGMTAGNALFFTLPFASSSYSSGSVSFGGSLTFTNTVLNPICNSGLGLGYFTACSSGNNPVNLLVSGISSGASDFARIDLTYFTA